MNLKKLIQFVLISFLLLSLPRTVNAQVLFNDDFEDGAIFDSWTHFSGSWTLESYNDSNWASIHSGSSTDNEIQAGDASLFDYEFKVDIHKIQGEDLNLFFRIQPARYTGLTGHSLPVGYGLHMKHGRFVLQKFTETQGIELPGTIYSESFLNNSVKKVRIQARQNNIKVFVDNSDTPIINYTDLDSPFLNGAVALASITGSAGTDYQFDNVVVSELPTETPSPTPTASPAPTLEPTPSPSPSPTATSSATPIALAVPSLKQYSQPWKNKTYDHIKATIEQFGCALTSVAMVLQYHGHNIMPDKLNDWLRNEPDGYIRNGLVNWLAVSRYTKIHDSINSPTLEYKRIAPTNENLTNELQSGRPAILKVPNHFVVAKSILPTTFGINDPGYANRNDLTAYGNTFQAINSYTPTHSDLSYMMFVVNPNINLKLYDSNNNLVNSQEFIDEALSGDINPNKKSGETVKVILFEKPDTGKYTLKVNGARGNYQLDSYLYNTSGKLSKNEFKGTLRGNDTDTFSISFEGKNKIKEKDDKKGPFNNGKSNHWPIFKYFFKFFDNRH